MSGIPNPTDIPRTIFAGDTLKFKVSNGDFPASGGWSYRLVLMSTSSKLTLAVSTADGDDHQVEVASTVTAAYATGEYNAVGYFSHSTSGRHSVDEGRVEIKADVAVATATDLRSHAKTSLDAIESVLESRASLDQMKFQLAGRSLERTPVEDLLKFRDYYRREVEKEERERRVGDGQSHSGRIRARFNN
tara:strand:- start:6303 stop:6872 length:570 start_codon:yes stop_codon:yes gene_type:complete